MTGPIRSLTILAAITAFVAGCSTSPEGPKADPLPVEVREVPARTMLVRSYVGPYAESPQNFEEFVGYAREKGIVPLGDLMGVFFDNPGSVPSDQTRYDLRLPVSADTTTDGPYGLLGVGKHEAAMVLLVGSYEAISMRYPEIFQWIGENGYEQAGPLTEVYLKHPGSGVPPDGYETEVMVPVRR